MNDVQLSKALGSLGMKCFVKYFKHFSDESLSRQHLIELLSREENYKYEASGTRISNARRIIKAGRAKDALNLIAESDKVPKCISDEARKLCDDAS